MPGDLGDRVRLVGRLERAGEQVLLADRLRAVARVDAARAEEHQSLDAGEVGAVDQVGLDLQVLVKELPALSVVCEDPTPHGRRRPTTNSGRWVFKKSKTAL